MPLAGNWSSTGGANEAALRGTPLALTFWRMQTRLELVTKAMSGLPSPSKSAMMVEPGPPGVERLKLGAKLLVVMLALLPINVGSKAWPEEYGK